MNGICVSSIMLESKSSDHAVMNKIRKRMEFKFKQVMGNRISRLLEGYQYVVIYGAGGVAKAAYRLLKEYCVEKTVHIAVTDTKKNPKLLEGIQVHSINEFLYSRFLNNALFIIAMMPSSADIVKNELVGNGCQNVLTADETAEILYREFYRNPIQKGKILFCNFSGRGYGCNPKYICEEILRRDLDIVDCVWADDGSGESVPQKIRTVKYGTYEYYNELATAQVWIDNQHKDFFSRKREGQYYVQTWHGNGPLKKIEYDAPGLLKSYLELLDHDMGMVDLCLSGSAFNSMLYKRAFHYEGDVLECGCPRNDIFFNKKLNLNKIRAGIGVAEDVAVILYAPTLRDGDSTLIDAFYMIEACQKLYNRPCVMLIREHPQMNMKAGRYVFSDRVINVSDYADVQELLAAADMLITDYSSVMWDFSQQRKPVFLYHPDLNVYEEERGVYIPFSEMPYIEAFDMEDLYRKICSYDDQQYRRKLEEFFKMYKPFDDGCASRMVTDKILDVIKNGV